VRENEQADFGGGASPTSTVKPALAAVLFPICIAEFHRATPQPVQLFCLLGLHAGTQGIEEFFVLDAADAPSFARRAGAVGLPRAREAVFRLVGCCAFRKAPASVINQAAGLSFPHPDTNPRADSGPTLRLPEPRAAPGDPPPDDHPIPAMRAIPPSTGAKPVSLPSPATPFTIGAASLHCESQRLCCYNHSAPNSPKHRGHFFKPSS
jgi:hypothetical protein